MAASDHCLSFAHLQYTAVYTLPQGYYLINPPFGL
jgi:hypothetical protein